MSVIGDSVPVAEFSDLPVTAFTTNRTVGTFGTMTGDPVRDVMGRWGALRRELLAFGARFATAGQVHSTRILTHDGHWRGWLRGEDADGHFSALPGTALAVTVADCVPVFIAHPRGATMMLHAGWRGTAAGILPGGIDLLRRADFDVGDAYLHLGPAICGRCYEVGPDVYAQLTGKDPGKPTHVDLRSILASQAREGGVRRVSVSELCTRCDNELLFSHRAGDAGRQLGVIVAHASS